MSEEATRESGERAAGVAAAAATWHSAVRTTPQDVVQLLNNPFPLPPGTVSVASSGPGRYDIFWLE